jgi:hypothetical protein
MAIEGRAYWIGTFMTTHKFLVYRLVKVKRRVVVPQSLLSDTPFAA